LTLGVKKLTYPPICKVAAVTEEYKLEWILP